MKPDWMREVDPQQAVPDRAARTLNVHVFSAHRPQVCVCVDRHGKAREAAGNIGDVRVQTGNPYPAVPPPLLPHLYTSSPQGKRVGVFKDDMYVELRVVGMPHDAATQSSPHKNNTGRLVVDQDFSFPVKFPEMAVLLVLLKDQDSVMSDTILGYTGIPLANLAPGEDCSSRWLCLGT